MKLKMPVSQTIGIQFAKLPKSSLSQMTANALKVVFNKNKQNAEYSIK